MTDFDYMRRAIRLAMNGRGGVEPNPMVGCVLVKNGRIVGEGFHANLGGPHAEPNALASCTESPAGAIAYVTLEPCCHTNKKTPPCVPRLIEAKLSRVMIGAVDPNPDVDGNGIRELGEAGIAVETGVLENEAKQLLAPYIARVVGKMPYATLKWAQSADGKIAGPGGRPMRISNERSSRLVHELRARCDAIIVGVNTVLTDDPVLTARGDMPKRPLIRYVLDRRLRIPLDSKLVNTARQTQVIINTSDDCRTSAKAEQLTAAGVRVVASDGLTEALGALSSGGAVHVLIEPGPTLAAAVFRENLCDRLWVFRSSAAIGDPTAPAAAEIPAAFVKTGDLHIEGDMLSEYLNPASPVFFSAEPSADFVLARESLKPPPPLGEG